MTTINTEWLEAFDEAMLGLFAIDHSDAGMDEFLLGCYADLPPREAALAFGEDSTAMMPFGHGLGWNAKID